jgi:hypothetical protein
MTVRFRVLRQHLGDRDYAPGDTREADPAVVAHLVAAGVLEEAQVEPPLETKAPVRSRARK